MPALWRQLVSDWLMQITVCARDWRMGEVRSDLVPGGVRVSAVIIWSSAWGPSGRDGDERKASCPVGPTPAQALQAPPT